MDLSPKFKGENFLCPHCNVASQQKWFDATSAGDVANQIVRNIFYSYRGEVGSYEQEAIAKFIDIVIKASNHKMSDFVPNGFSVATCSTCSGVSLWMRMQMVYPKKAPVPPPNSDMEQAIQDLYIEASAIVVDSPKGATALLRLALQLLLKQLGKSGKNINDDIKDLVANGLSPKIQQALDLLRVVGNNAVHPGQINLDDNNQIAIKLFHVLNFIANEMITKPNELELLYQDIIPEETKKYINQRDGK